LNADILFDNFLPDTFFTKLIIGSKVYIISIIYVSFYMDGRSKIIYMFLIYIKINAIYTFTKE